MAEATKKEYLKLAFPYPDSVPRLQRYQENQELFQGKHFTAFKVRVQHEEMNKKYAELKYIVANFAGLISKVAADMLFGETSKYRVSEGDQDFLDALVKDNKLHVQNYESALSNSRNGDAVYKLRIGKRRPQDKNPTIIIEDITPSIYFPHLDASSVREEPSGKELAWVVKIGNENYLRQEIHTPGLIENKLWKLKDGKIDSAADLSLLGIPGLLDQEKVLIDDSLIFHIPNWKDGSSYFGNDDYADLWPLFYAINNRMTKTENILDKHSDPILALPEGVLDETGKVKKEAFTMFEIPNNDVGATAKPEYIVWNASLESNFSHIEKLVQMLYMFSETSPDAFGMGENQTESGRALKLRLMRTIAKISRKRLYYDAALKEMLLVAQKLAAAYKVGVGPDQSLKLKKAPGEIEIDWQDGLPIDAYEAAQEEELRINSGTTSKKRAIMRLDDVDEDGAEEILKEIEEEDKIEMPTAGLNPAASANNLKDEEADPDKPDNGEPKPPAVRS